MKIQKVLNYKIEQTRQEINREQILESLKLPYKQRSVYQQTNIYNFLSELKFFKDNVPKCRIVHEISEHLQLESQLRGTVEIKYGEMGDKFYILMKGKCSVWLPIPFSKQKVFVHLFERLAQSNIDYEVLKKAEFEFYHSNSENKEVMFCLPSLLEQFPDLESLPRENVVDLVQKIKVQVAKKIAKLVFEQYESSNVKDVDIMKKNEKLLSKSTFNGDNRFQFAIRRRSSQQETWIQKFKTSVAFQDVDLGCSSCDSDELSTNRHEQLEPDSIQSLQQIQESILDSITAESIPIHRITIQNSELLYMNGQYQLRVSEIHRGAAFGQLALENQDGKRNATIVCETDTIFATLDRKTFQYVKQQNKDRSNQKMFNFLSSLYYFRNLSKHQIQKFMNSVKKLKYLRHQAVYREDDPCTHIYIVYEGRFELSKKLDKKCKSSERQQLIFNRLLGEQLQQPNILQQKLQEIKDFPSQQRLMIYEEGSLLGEEDAICRETHSANLVCVSGKGKLYKIQKEAFFSLKKDEQMWKQVQSQIVFKEHTRQAMHISNKVPQVPPRTAQETLKVRIKQKQQQQQEEGSVKMRSRSQTPESPRKQYQQVTESSVYSPMVSKQQKTAAMGIDFTPRAEILQEDQQQFFTTQPPVCFSPEQIQTDHSIGFERPPDTKFSMTVPNSLFQTMLNKSNDSWNSPRTSQNRSILLQQKERDYFQQHHRRLPFAQQYHQPNSMLTAYSSKAKVKDSLDPQQTSPTTTNSIKALNHSQDRAPFFQQRLTKNTNISTYNKTKSLVGILGEMRIRNKSKPQNQATLQIKKSDKMTPWVKQTLCKLSDPTETLLDRKYILLGKKRI